MNVLVTSLKRWLAPAWRALIHRLDFQYEKALDLEVGGNCASLLDVGCGFNSPVQSLTSRPRRLIGVDAYAPVLELGRAKNTHDEYYNIHVLDIEKQFGPKSFECVLASDLIEHLTPEDGMTLLSRMESIATKKVIVYTPNGYLSQGEVHGNPLQVHLSGWTVKQMKDLGLRVTGIQGLKGLRGEMAAIKWRPTRLWLLISLLSQRLVTKHPRFAFRILCVKDILRTS